MTTITLGHPEKNNGEWMVFGFYEDEDDRFVFGVRKFASDQKERAEEYACRLMDLHNANHLIGA